MKYAIDAVDYWRLEALEGRIARVQIEAQVALAKARKDQSAEVTALAEKYKFDPARPIRLEDDMTLTQADAP